MYDMMSIQFKRRQNTEEAYAGITKKDYLFVFAFWFCVGNNVDMFCN
jgi:hypothetical protein